jgi:hypothetical protein
MIIKINNMEIIKILREEGYSIEFGCENQDTKQTIILDKYDLINLKKLITDKLKERKENGF